MFSRVAGSAPEAKRLSLMRCGGQKTGLPTLTALRASLNEPLPSGADKTKRPLDNPNTSRLRLSEASRLILFALGLQWVNSSACPPVTRSSISVETVDLLRLLA